MFIEYILTLDRIIIGLQPEPTRPTLPMTGLRALLTKDDPGVSFDSQVKLMGMYLCDSSPGYHRFFERASLP